MLVDCCAIKGIIEVRYLSVDLQLTPACSLSIYSKVGWFVYDAACRLQTRTITFHLHQERETYQDCHYVIFSFIMRYYD